MAISRDDQRGIGVSSATRDALRNEATRRNWKLGETVDLLIRWFLTQPQAFQAYVLGHISDDQIIRDAYASVLEAEAKRIREGGDSGGSKILDARTPHNSSSSKRGRGAASGK
jgi:hypothetical protein